MTEKEKNVVVFKANKLIEARYNLTLTEQKLILYSASQVDNFGGDNFTLLKMNISDFFEIAGIDKKSRNQKHIKKTAKGLMDKKIEIEKPNDGWLIMNWVSSCEYKPKEGIIEFEFSQKMRPYLLKLEEHYKGYPLREVMQLGSKYAIRLYELLIQWEYTNHKSLTISVEELRKKMGVEDTEYERFTNFEDRVIKSAVTELNNVSNIFVTYEKIKLGRRIDKIKFKFNVKGKDESEAEKELEGYKDAKLVDYIEIIKEILNDEELAFTDLQIDKAYNATHKKIANIEIIQNNYIDAVGAYMLYYYEYTKDKAHKRAFNYYLKALEEDYSNIIGLYKFGRDPHSVKYGKLFEQGL